MNGSWRGGRQDVTVRPFRDLRTLGHWLVRLMVISIAVDLIAIYLDLDYLDFFSRVRSGEAVTIEEALSLDRRQGQLAVAQIGIFILVGIAFLVWFRRAYRNLPSLGARWLRFAPGWAIGSWFVPLLNLVRPKEIANDIWRVSDPSLPPELDDPALGGRVSPLLDAWWAAFLLFGGFARVVARSDESATTVEELERVAQMTMWLDAAAIGVTLLWLWVVRSTTARQLERHATLARIEKELGDPSLSEVERSDNAT